MYSATTQTPTNTTKWNFRVLDARCEREDLQNQWDRRPPACLSAMETGSARKRPRESSEPEPGSGSNSGASCSTNELVRLPRGQCRQAPSLAFPALCRALPCHGALRAADRLARACATVAA